MKTRITGIILVGLLLLGCGSSSVYQMPEAQQKGITYQTYQQSPDQTYSTLNGVLKSNPFDILMDQAWEIKSSDEQGMTIETEWRDGGGSQSVSGGKVAGSSSDERYRLKAKVTDSGSGSKVSIELQKQVKMSEWRAFEVKKQTAQNYIQPIFDKLEEKGLSMQS